MSGSVVIPRGEDNRDLIWGSNGDGFFGALTKTNENYKMVEISRKLTK
jgi:hypothetical protein